MASLGLQGVIGQLRHIAAASGHVPMTDEQLLNAFRAGADDAAFEVLVRRHGPMVLGTCRRIVGTAQDAEDAFQAVFLILARKAHTIDRPDLLGPWLYVVACRTARKARALLARRRGRERPLTERDDPVTTDCDPCGDLRAVLDEALEGLPATYRSAVVLCELQGRSRQQAACALGVPEGTVSSRLARGKQLLAKVLRRRGLVLSATTVTGLLAQCRTDANVPAALVRSTAALGVAIAAGQAALLLVSAPVALLTEGVLNTMTSTKLKIVLGVFIALALCAGALFPRSGGVQQVSQAQQPVVKSVVLDKEAAPRKPSVILLWMGGGPSQMDTFDLKPGQANGGPFRAIDTAVKGIRISEHLPKLAKHMKEMVLIRSVTHREGDHARATHLMTTGYAPQQGAQHATIAEVLAKELGGDKSTVPTFVRPASGPFLFRPAVGMLGKRYLPLRIFGGPQGLQLPEEGMFMDMAGAQAEAWHKAMTKAIDLSAEKESVRKAYGEHAFGTHCLLARRLVEVGVSVVEIELGGWDTHGNNFAIVEKQSAILDAGWSALMADLKERKLLDTTLIIWMGEFGRTPRINANQGRDHWPMSFTVVLAGGGIKGGQVVGQTNADGAGVANRPVTVPGLYATIYEAVGVNRKARYPSAVEGVNIPIIDGPAEPIGEILPASAKK
jgi:RNA polymerase sigma factor (sigma-70 family)